VSISTAIASRQWIWSLGCAAAILIVCVVIPRGFCGYICPLGTLIDLFDWALGRRFQRFRVPAEGWWVHLKYYLLLGSLICACFGVLVTGYVAAIPIVTRGFLMVGEPLQSGLLRGWHLVPSPTSGTFISLALFCFVLALGLLQPRFWCKYVCPSGAVFSLGNLFRITERKVESSCIHCNKCIEVCPFDAIKPDFTTRVTDCTLCQTCGGVCPTHAIKFVDRGNVFELKVENDPPTGETPLGRRGFLAAAVGTAASVASAAMLTGVTKSHGAKLSSSPQWLPIRPPGSVPELEFLQMCIRCGECFKACPNNVLQPMSLQQGLEGIWTPHVVADWAGCESSCNACGQVCPTGAIRALPIEEKRHARIGLAIVDTNTCLPFADREACQLCVDECNAAGYEAIEFTRVHTQIDAANQPLEGSGYLAPVVMDDKCVGCGLCQTRCHGINVETRNLLRGSAIVVAAGPGREDRLLSGSYREAARQRSLAREAHQQIAPTDFYVPPPSHRDRPQPAEGPPSDDTDDDPFGLK
jgi:ferredoxin